MELSKIITIITIIVTYTLGKLSKKNEYIRNELIPLQNLAIGLIAGFIYYIITKDFSLTISAVGLGTGGAYDILHNLGKLLDEVEDDYEEDRY